MRIVRVQHGERLIREYRDWEGELPLPGDALTVTLDPRTSPARPGRYTEPGVEATFKVVRRRFARIERPGVAVQHMTLLTVEPL